MRLLAKARDWLLRKLLPFKIIRLHGEDYLVRYYICGHPPSTIDCRPRLPWMRTLYLHEIKCPDTDRALHNHPWDRSWSLILWGGYREQRLDGSVDEAWCREIMRRAGLPTDPYVYADVRPGHINIIDHGAYHRIDALLGRGSTWTLFSPGRRVSSWGFLDDNFTHHPYVPGEEDGPRP